MYNIQKYNPRILFFAKLLILVLAYHTLSERLQDTQGLGMLMDRLYSAKGSAVPFLILIFSMTLMNWLLEIQKWKTLVNDLKPISYMEATRQSLCSLAVSILTPNRVGEYGVKAMYYEPKDRLRILLYNFLGNSYQLGATMLFGLVGFLLFGGRYVQIPDVQVSWKELGLTVLVGALLSSVLFLFFRGSALRSVEHFKSIRKHTHLRVMGLSLLRYAVFSQQFYLLLLFFGCDLDYLSCISLISLTYLFSSVIPGFVVFDWIVKGTVAAVLFSQFGVNEILVLSVTGSMWLLNFGFPTLIGTAFVLGFNRPVTRVLPVREKSDLK